MAVLNPHIERHLEPEVSVRLWKQGDLTTLCRIDGPLIADLFLGRSVDAKSLLQYLYATPQRIIDLRGAHYPDVRPETVEHAAKSLTRWDVEGEGRVTVLMVETDLGYGFARIMAAHSAFMGSKITVCRSLEEVERLFDLDLDWYKHL